jgi:ammonia channel protein AmtB
LGAQAGQPPISLLGQIFGTAICAVLLGFIPGYVSSGILKVLGLLRVPPEAETKGLDIHDLGVTACPEQHSLATSRI